MISNEVDKEVMEQRNVAQADDHLDRLLMSIDLEEPWYKSIMRSIREARNASETPASRTHFKARRERRHGRTKRR